MDPSKGRGKQKMKQISEDFTNMSLDSAADDGPWKVPKRKSNNRPWAPPITVPNRPRGPPAPRGTGRGNIRPFYPSNPIVPPPPRASYNLGSARPGASSTTSSIGSYPVEDDDDVDNDDVVDSDEDDDEPLSDDTDSEASALSFESRKKHKLLKGFFSDLEKLSVEEINSTEWRGHCPACQGGPGAIAWYQGLQALMTHAKTKGSKRVKLHREFAEVVDEEVRRRGASIIPAGETFGKWEGVKGSLKDREIVWPPMVVIMNTKFEQIEDDRWIGMGNSELLLNYFSDYGPKKATHSYGPQGHRGMSMLVFESSAIGYMKAKRLHKLFKQQSTDREAWDHNPILFNPGGIRQLYGFMADRHDLDFFNQHAQGGKSAKSKLKYEVRSYEEMVMSQLYKMCEDNEKLTFYQDKATKAEMHSKAVEQSFELVSGELRKKDEEVRILRQRSRLHHQQNKEEMDSQELFFKNQLKNIHDARDTKEDSFERLQDEELKKVKQSKTRREVENFIISKDKSMAEFEVERNNLMEIYEEKRDAMKQRHLCMYYEEAIELEKQLDAQLNHLMDKYALHN